MKSEYRHIPVMLEEIVSFFVGDAKNYNHNYLNSKIFVDATLGGAGHSVVIAQYLGEEGFFIGIDKDINGIKAARSLFDSQSMRNCPFVEFVNDNFGNLDDILLKQRVAGIDAILFDLGMSSHQIDDISRGFTFKKNSVLDMRMNQTAQTLTAKEIVNTYKQEDLAKIIFEYSDEKFAKNIAREIVKYRQNKTIEYSSELVDIVKCAIPCACRRRGGHPAKRTFQALRIEVNDEISVLKNALDAAIRWLNPGGKIAVISYHSIEDKIVKSFFKSMENRCSCPADLPKCVCGNKPVLKLCKKKAILPSEVEVEKNARSRSAKLRTAIKI